MNELEKQGRNDILRSLASNILFSIYVSVSYHISLGYVDGNKLVVHIVRFLLTLIILYLVFQGYSWARNLFSILIAIGIVMLVPPVFNDVPLVNKIPLFTGLLIYSLTLYRLNFSPNSKAYFAYTKAHR